MQSIRLAGIIHDSLTNGEGLRRVFFSQGCDHNCKGCFNKHTHSFNGGKIFDVSKLVLNVVEDPLIKGVTFSGGDPFQQARPFMYMALYLRNRGINIWSYTGYNIEEILNSNDIFKKQLLANIDVLVDGQYIEEYKVDGLKYRGSKNQRIIDVQKTLITGKITLLQYDNIGYLEEECGK